MQLGMIGLGRMGGNIVRRLRRAGHDCVVYNRSPEPARRLAAESGAVAVTSLADLVGKLEAPRAAWVMVPAGDATERTVAELAELMQPGDIIIDGGNSYFKDDIRRAEALEAKGLRYLDVGTSGGVWGLERGYCMMIGGERDAVEHLDPVFAALAPGEGDIERTPGREARQERRVEMGYMHCGPAGAGHFVKMVHNGIEYGLMQAYAEGFDIMKNAPAGYDLDLADVAEVWRRGSVVTSWLLDLTAMALVEDGELSRYSGHVQDSGEGRWTVMTAVEQAVPADVLSAALYTRFRSRQQHTFAEKVLSAMREKFGGHREPSEQG